LDGRHRKHARVESKIRDQKASGIGLLPSRKLNINAAWLTATTLAADLRCCFQLLALNGETARATSKTLRYRVRHVPARLARGQRKQRLKLPGTWPWADIITRAFRRILALPHPPEQHERSHRAPRGGHQQAPGPWNPASSGTPADAHAWPAPSPNRNQCDITDARSTGCRCETTRLEPGLAAQPLSDEPCAECDYP
jgi:hypothetical protein